MSILSDFEDRIGRAVEGGFARVFRSPVQPAELARKLRHARWTAARRSASARSTRPRSTTCCSRPRTTRRSADSPRRSPANSRPTSSATRASTTTRSRRGRSCASSSTASSSSAASTSSASCSPPRNSPRSWATRPTTSSSRHPASRAARPLAARWLALRSPPRRSWSRRLRPRHRAGAEHLRRRRVALTSTPTARAATAQLRCELRRGGASGRAPGGRTTSAAADPTQLIRRRPLATVTVRGVDHDVVLRGDRMVVGRLATCDICLADANTSRQHAAFEREDGGWARRRPRLDQRHARQRPARRPRQRLRDGDVIVVGITELVYHEPRG